MPSPRMCFSLLLSAAVLAPVVGRATAADPKPEPPAPVSFYKQIRPIFQANCQGCHQPAKAGGGYVMTDFGKLLTSADSGKTAVAPGKPDQSELVNQIAVHDGKAKMPKKAKPLHPTEIDLISRWIAQGATDDTPPNAVVRYDVDHPPVYTRQPVITSVDFSPDGATLAVAGFHEVLLTDPNTGTLTGRLIGLSERVQAVKFSPAGDRLAVSGGNPGRLGEFQIWDVAKRKLLLSRVVGFDTLFGVSWSPDGKTVAVGCTDNTVRAFDAATGEQVLQQGAHDDWPLDTVFSRDGSHLISVGRDMTAKLTEVATQRFVDNVTSITPGALKGGIQSIDRHPGRDEILVGGSDGVPKVYRIYRTTARQIGDDANLIRKFPQMTGRIFGVAVSRDGKRIAAGSTLDSRGEIEIAAYEADQAILQKIREIEKTPLKKRTKEQKAELDKLKSVQPSELVKAEVPAAGVYAVAFRPDGLVLAVAGTDGVIRLFDTEDGHLVKEYAAAPRGNAAPAAATRQAGQTATEETAAESIPAGVKVAALEVNPAEITLTNRFGYAQIVATARLESGEQIDVTRTAELAAAGGVIRVDRSGVVRGVADGRTDLTVSLGGKKLVVPVTVSGTATEFKADFIRDVNPVLSRLGCNQGTCHGSAKGKNGFKLSLRGYDAEFDLRALTDDLAARRVNVASPDDSLMLLKATGAVPHVGGQLTRPGEAYYELIRSWIAAGGALQPKTPRVVKIDVFPRNPVAQRLGDRQQLRVVATYADGVTRDVTREAFLDSGNTEVATSDRRGLMTAVRRGEAPVLARFEGSYAATTLTVMGSRDGFAWQDVPAYNKIDEFTAAKWKRLKIRPSDLCTDDEFLRRVTLDLTGLPPAAAELQAFLADPRDAKTKREAVVDRLIGSKEYVEYWTNKWADLLQVNRKFLGTEGAVAFRAWIRDEVKANTPYDVFARKVLTAAGSNQANPPASYFKILRDPAPTMENTTHLFLAVRFNCNKCHDHPFERWTQDQYYHLAAYFAQTGLSPDPTAGDRKVGGTAVEGAKPLFEIVSDRQAGEVTHDRTGAVSQPMFPYPAKAGADAHATRRAQLAAWITSPDNQYFAKSYVNRLWGYSFGVGIIEPIDDIRAGNPATNPELLDYLTAEFVKAKFDVRHVQRLICTSRTYQLSFRSNQWNRDDKTNFSHAAARRLPAEVLYDTLHKALESRSNIPGVPPGTRAAELPDVGVELPSGFLAAFGRPVRESACECERSSGLQLGPVMALVNGQTIAEAINDPGNVLPRLAQEKDDAKLINELFLRLLSRPATAAEIAECRPILSAPAADHQKLVAKLKAAEAEAAQKRANLEREHAAALARAKDELAAREKEIAPAVADAERQRAARIKAAKDDLQKYEAALPAKLPEWEKRQKSAVAWVPLDPKELKASNGATLTKEPDHSVFVTGKTGRANYTVVAETDLTGVTAVRLEAMADDRLPARGPGREPNGNFVLNQLKIVAKSKKHPTQVKEIHLHNAKADFSQENFSPGAAVDGSPNGGKGWAVAPNAGVTHWAVFETKELAGFEGGTTLTITMMHQFDDSHAIGRFRLSVSQVKPPVPLGLPEDLRKLLEIPAGKRDQAQQAALMSFFRGSDADLAKHHKAVAAAEQPLPVDPKVKELRENVEIASRPIPEDARLVQLRRDVEQSAAQAANSRLTGTQDIAWALINSPSFLFNR